MHTLECCAPEVRCDSEVGRRGCVCGCERADSLLGGERRLANSVKHRWAASRGPTRSRTRRPTASMRMISWRWRAWPRFVAPGEVLVVRALSSACWMRAARAACSSPMELQERRAACALGVGRRGCRQVGLPRQRESQRVRQQERELALRGGGPGGARHVGHRLTIRKSFRRTLFAHAHRPLVRAHSLTPDSAVHSGACVAVVEAEVVRRMI